MLMCASRRPVKEELFILRQLSRIDCFGFLSKGRILRVFVQLMLGLAPVFQAGRLAMAASLFRAMMCFLKT